MKLDFTIFLVRGIQMYFKQKDYCFDALRTKDLNEEKAISKSIK